MFVSRVKTLNDKAAHLAVASGLALSSGLALADPFADAITAASASIATYGAALVTIAFIGVGFMIAMKYVKKISRAA